MVLPEMAIPEPVNVLLLNVMLVDISSSTPAQLFAHSELLNIWSSEEELTNTPRENVLISQPEIVPCVTFERATPKVPPVPPDRRQFRMIKYASVLLIEMAFPVVVIFNPSMMYGSITVPLPGKPRVAKSEFLDITMGECSVYAGTLPLSRTTIISLESLSCKTRFLGITKEPTNIITTKSSSNDLIVVA